MAVFAPYPWLLPRTGRPAAGRIGVNSTDPATLPRAKRNAATSEQEVLTQIGHPRAQSPKYSLINLSTASLCFARSQAGARIWADEPNPRIQARNSSTPETTSK